LQQQHDELKTEIGIGGMGEAQGELLIDQRRLMPDLRTIRSDLKQSRAAVAETRLSLYQNQRDLRNSPETVAASLLEDSGTSLTGESRERVLSELVALIGKRNELLQELNGQYRRLLTEEGDHDLALRQLADLTVEAETFLNEKLLWVRSSEPISLSTFSEVPSGLAWLFGADHYEELKAAMIGLGDHSPVLMTLTGALFLFLILTRSRCKRKITDLGHKVRKISTDRYRYTLEAFLLTLVLVVPYAIIPTFIGWRLLHTPNASDWLQGLAEGLFFSGYLLAVILFTRAFCRKGGVAEQHFRWNSQALVSLRENVTWISILYIPASIVAAICLNEKSATHLGSIGRLTFIAVMLWVAFFLRRMLDKKTGVICLIIEDQPEGFIARLHKFWTFLFVSFPLILMVLAMAGYILTGLTLMRQFRLTIEIIGIGAVAYALIMRWFSMRERRLVLEQRIRERQERAEAESKESKGVVSESIDESGLQEFDEDTIDFEEVGEQTRRLISFVVGAVVAIAIWFGWADILPALQGLNDIKIPGGISLGALIPAIFILIVTSIGARNLPGLLEIGILSHIPLDAGLRYTIISLCQYLVVAIGLSLMVGVLGVDWSSFGWIVAALSVGLGFGLQEIVANFVCGIILLFERPIRVGDVVTVSGTTGVVSRIRIRATTIIDRDQKEFIVPNKEFITGSLLNWTLSTTLNRIVIVVGVAYGSDTRRARDLLLEICNAQPHILKDPATSVVFDAFGDSTLNFTVRTYLASMENRLGVTNDLHHEIHERFAAEGIEIAFPQMDLHLRSVDPGVQWGGGQAPEPGKV
jgi:potassium efflux system protein